jgi:hypothetical protein
MGPAMTRLRAARVAFPVLFSALLLEALAACDPPPPPKAAPPPPAAPSPPPAPATKMKMICRSSQTGVKAECGTPGAVMVGMEPA